MIILDSSALSINFHKVKHIPNYKYLAAYFNFFDGNFLGFPDN